MERERGREKTEGRGEREGERIKDVNMRICM
jgi:hypothetical protein